MSARTWRQAEPKPLWKCHIVPVRARAPVDSTAQRLECLGDASGGELLPFLRKLGSRHGIDNLQTRGNISEWQGRK